MPEMSPRGLSGLQRRLLAAVWQPGQEPVPLLGGGTALAAFYCFHRRSDDIDLFVTHPADVARLGAAVPSIVATALPEAVIEPMGIHPLQYRYLVTHGGDTTVVDVALIETAPTTVHVLEGIHVLGIQDIAAGKLAAAARRTELKDAVDLWALRTIAGLDRAELVACAQRVEPAFILDPTLLSRILARLTEAVTSLPMPDASIVDRDELQGWLGAELLEALSALPIAQPDRDGDSDRGI